MKTTALEHFILEEACYHSETSIVYRGVDPESGAVRILKLLNADYPTNHQLARFNYEYLITEKAQAPGIIRTFGIKAHRRTLFMVLEDIGGIALSTLIKPDTAGAPGALSGTIALALSIIRALGQLHQKNIIHTNLQPGNIVVNPATNDLRLIDLGNACLLEKGSQEVAMPTIPDNAYPFISPEQTGRINREMDYRTDFYSLGATLYQLFTGHLPFDATDPLGWVYCHIARKPVPLTDVAPAIPKPLSDCVMKCLEKNPEDRYQSIQGIYHDLERCRNALLRDGRVPDFILGEKDVSDRIRIPSTIYGREAETDSMRQTFARICGGARETLLISGPSGIGKTALVNELYEPVVVKKGWFVSGKFDPFSRNSSYDGFIQLFQELANKILREPDEAFTTWQRRLTSRVGENLRLIIDLVPEIEAIVGPKPPVTELNPEEARNRFMMTLVRFVQVFIQDGHPLVFFLDDLQWADTASIDLIETLMRQPELHHLLILGAFRDAETQTNPSLTRLLDTHSGYSHCTVMALTHLDEHAINTMVSKTLHRSLEDCRILSSILHTKTGGNPFYLRELLRKLYREDVFTLSRTHGHYWTWDVDAVENIDVSPNVVEFLLTRLERLTRNAREALMRAACIGNLFSLKLLSIIMKRSVSETADILWEPIQEGMILPVKGDYYLARIQQGQEDFDVQYRFLHDRIQQASYLLVDKARAGQIHLAIGRRILHALPSDAQDSELANCVRQLNRGRSLMEDASERIRLAGMNHAIGIRAMASSAYESAFKHMSIARELLGPSPWTDHYDLSFSICRSFAESAYLCGDFDTAEAQCTILMEKAGTSDTKAEIHHLRMIYQIFLGRVDHGIQSGLEALKALGLPIPKAPSLPVIIIALLAVRRAMAWRNVSDLADLQLVDNPRFLLVYRVLQGMAVAAHLSGNMNLFMLSSLKAVALSMKHGNTPESAPCYVGYAIILTSLGKYRAGYAMGKVALSVNRQLQDIRFRPIVRYGFGSHIQDWLEPRANCLENIKTAIEAGYQTGDYLTVSFAFIIQIRWLTDKNLSEALHLAEDCLEKVRAMNIRIAQNNIILFLSYISNLMGRTPSRSTLSYGSLTEPDLLENLNQLSAAIIPIYHLRKWDLALIYGDRPAAQKQMKNVLPYKKQFKGRNIIVYTCLNEFITLADSYAGLGPAGKLSTRQTLRRLMKKMVRWANLCPANYRHSLLFMKAERFRIQGSRSRAAAFYTEAMEEARKNALLYYEAYYTEKAALFYLAEGMKDEAHLYLKEARYLYQRWGASGKVTQMDENHPGLNV